MGDKVLKIGTVHQCNCCLGSKTLHPLVSVIDLSKADLSPHTDIKFDFYTILLSECKCEAYMYGHQYYDHSRGSPPPCHRLDMPRPKKYCCRETAVFQPGICTSCPPYPQVWQRSTITQMFLCHTCLFETGIPLLVLPDIPPISRESPSLSL